MTRERSKHMRRRFYFMTDSSSPDSVCNDYIDNIRGARTYAQKVANEIGEIVSINDCETDNIEDFAYPDVDEHDIP